MEAGLGFAEMCDPCARTLAEGRHDHDEQRNCEARQDGQRQNEAPVFPHPKIPPTAIRKGPAYSCGEMPTVQVEKNAQQERRVSAPSKREKIAS